MSSEILHSAASCWLSNAGSINRLNIESAVWMRDTSSVRDTDQCPLRPEEVSEARARFVRFRPVLRTLFPQNSWDGVIRSALKPYPLTSSDGASLLVKCDHALPMTGSVKARGGVYDILCHVEDLLVAGGLWCEGQPIEQMLNKACRGLLSAKHVVVASTGNLGFSVGLIARAFGLNAEVHMSHDAKAWKKARLTTIGATVIEENCDYTETVGRARQSALQKDAYFVDDENSRRLFVGYSVAASELAEQLTAAGVTIDEDTQLIVYLPCGVGGAPGGITAGLKAIFGERITAVFVEPAASAGMFAALAYGKGAPASVYDYGMDNVTIADGLAVPVASQLVLNAIGRSIDAVVTVSDQALRYWVKRAWHEAALRLEPSAAAGFAAIEPFMQTIADSKDNRASRIKSKVQVVWTTGGLQMPQDEFQSLLQT